jgi:hypothetical protein
LQHSRELEKGRKKPKKNSIKVEKAEKGFQCSGFGLIKSGKD